MALAARRNAEDPQTVLTLAAGDMTLALEPGLGGSVLGLRHKATPLLRETPAGAAQAHMGRAYAAYPLLPFAGRLRGGAFTWRGESYQLGRDIEDRRHALHGEARFAPWTVEKRSTTHTRLSLRHEPAPFAWPFAFEAWQELTLSPTGLRLTLGLRNTHKAAAPAGVGWALHLPRLPFTRLRFDAAYSWGCDLAGIPVVSIPDTGRFTARRAQVLDESLVDGEYGGFGGTLHVEAPQRPSLRLSADAVFSHLSIAVPLNQPFFTLGVATHRPDAVSPNDDPLDAGMVTLAPGESLQGSVELGAE